MITQTREIDSLFTKEFKDGYYAGVMDTIRYARQGVPYNGLADWITKLRDWKNSSEDFAPMPKPESLERKEDGSSS